jgi:predicted P-loop ATPase
MLRTVWSCTPTVRRGKQGETWVDRPAMDFPTPAGLTPRIRYLDGLQSKTGWPSQKERAKHQGWGPGKGSWYGLDQALPLLPLTGGTLYFVNGEPSVWAAHQSGVPAVCTCMGEKSGLPPLGPLVAALASHKARICVVYDNDEAGREGAAAAVRNLRKAGLEAVALQLPDDLGEHGDVDDLHRRTGDEGLAAALAALPELPVPETSTSPAPNSPPEQAEEGLRFFKDAEGKTKPTTANLLIWLRGSPFAPYTWINGFDGRLYRGRPDENSVAWTDTDATRLVEQLEREFGMSWKPDVVYRSIAVVSEDRQFNPLTAYLEGAKWDGTSRLDTWLIDAAGAADTPLIRAYSRKFLIQAVARAREPGCQADATLVLVGPQGIGKSTLLQTLAGEAFFVDTPIDLAHRSAYQVLACAWIYEFSELYSLTRAEIESTKAFLTSRFDTYTPPYGRMPVRCPRHTVFCATTNDDAFLRDPTGSRRFWPVVISRVDLALIREIRDQLWAEAVACYRASAGQDFRWWLSPAEDRAAQAHASGFQEEDSWQPLVEGILAELPVPKGIGLGDLAQRLRDRSRPGGEPDRWGESRMGSPELARDSRQTDLRLRNILKRLGWKTTGRPEWDPIAKKVARLWRPDLDLTPYGDLTASEEGSVRSESPAISATSGDTLRPYGQLLHLSRGDEKGGGEGGAEGAIEESRLGLHRKVLGSPDSYVDSTTSDLTVDQGMDRKVACFAPEKPLSDPSEELTGDLHLDPADPFLDPLDDADDLTFEILPDEDPGVSLCAP